MPPAVTGETKPAASPTNSKRCARADDSATGNHAGAHGSGPQLAKVEQRRNFFQERRHRCGRGGLITAHAPREADLNDPNSGHDPGDISGRQTTIDKTVELFR